MIRNHIYQGDAIEVLRTLPDGCVQTVVTSPPYWALRDYGVPGQIGLEKTPEEYVAKMCRVFREVRRVLRDDGTLWLNLGDSYYNGNKGGYERSTTGKQATNLGTVKGLTMNRTIQEGLKPKDMIGIPWMVAFALRADGWYLRCDIIWSKPNPMPESVTDRPTKSHEFLFLLSKSQKYYYDAAAIREERVTLEGRPDAIVRDREYEYDSKQAVLHHRNTGVGFGHGTDKELRARDRVRGSVGVINNPPNSARRRSGNLERKIGDERGRPGSHLGGSVPWEGSGRNRRTVWTITTSPYKEAHFATFPPALVEPCILAGSSPQACPVCGAPWGRVIEKQTVYEGHSAQAGRSRDEINASGKWAGQQDGNKDIKMGPVSISTTTGWQPTCSCLDNDGSGRSLVLDPFMGSGTTAKVAFENGRDYVGFDLNPQYIEMANRRLKGAVCQERLFV